MKDKLLGILIGHAIGLYAIAQVQTGTIISFAYDLSQNEVVVAADSRTND